MRSARVPRDLDAKSMGEAVAFVATLRIAASSLSRLVLSHSNLQAGNVSRRRPGAVIERGTRSQERKKSYHIVSATYFENYWLLDS
jgi:hypothetical protein